MFDFRSAFKLIGMDEFADQLLHATALLDIDLPLLPRRFVLEESDVLKLEPRCSLLSEEFEELLSHGEIPDNIKMFGDTVPSWTRKI